jgi:hypothetical protein
MMMQMQSAGLRLLMLVGLLVALTACPARTPTPAPTNTPEPTSGPTPTEEPEQVETPSTSEPPGGAAEDELAALVAAKLGITTSGTTTATIGIEGVKIVALENTLSEAPLWLAYTYGLRNFEPMQHHAIAIYTRQDNNWEEITTMLFTDMGAPEEPGFSPDFVGEGSVTQVQIEPSHLWIQVEGGVGAHSGVYGLFSFDGSTLTEQVKGFSASPGVGQLRDLNGDGVQEVLLDASEYYVFCYACGVRRVQYEVYRWDGAQMVRVMLSPLSEAAPAEVREFNDNLVALAQAGLWKDALAMLPEAAAFSYSEPAFSWNLAYIRLNAEARKAEAEGESPAYPLLDQVFFGDFEAAVDILRDAGADAIFIPDTPLVVGTVAEGWEPTLADWITTTVDSALAVQPDLAPAYFLRGWAIYLATQDETAVLPDVQRAAELAPDDELYTKSVDFLGGEIE